MGKFSWEIIAEKDALIAELERKLMSENAHIESIRQQLAERDALLRDGIGLVTGVSYRSPAETIKSYNWLVKTKEVLGE